MTLGIDFVGRKSGPHTANRLTALAVTKTKKVGRHADGGGLYLQVSPSGGKSWVFRFMLDGKAREMGLGPVQLVSLEAAREVARAHRASLKQGTDPLKARDDARSSQIAASEAQSDDKTFMWCCETYITKVRGPELTNPKHVAQWRATLATYTYPQLGSRLIKTVTMEDVRTILDPIWLTKTETASRVRQRMEAVFAWAKVKAYRSGDNPATWKGALDHLLAKPSKVKDESHFPALPFDRAPGFMTALAGHRGMSAKALQFLVLTAARTNPVLLAEWPEIDFERRVWEAPADKMKMPHAHRTPLSRQALDVLAEVRALASGTYIFQNGGEPLSNAAMLMLVGGMHTSKTPWVDPKQSNKRITPHGFRSTFRDWAGDMTDFPEEICELALAHSTGNKTEAAYRRADALEKRRPLMQAWADFCTPEKDPAEAG